MSASRRWSLWLSKLLTVSALVALPMHSALAQEDAYEDEPAAEADDENAIADDDPSAIVIFRDHLAPHGTWTVHPDYGTVWVPSARAVGPDFAPYVSRGHWELTPESEWLWVSEYDWGYVPFHYGRWVYISDIGWSWIPGRVYAPAWVIWRVGADGYIGWAPAPAAYYWLDGYAAAFWTVPVAAYVFCPTASIFHSHVDTVIVHDHKTVQRAVEATKPYRPSRPAREHRTREHRSATPTQGDDRNSPRSGPSTDEAGIKKSDVKLNGKHDAKALDFMKPAAIAKSKGLAKQARSSKPTSTLANTAARTKGAGVQGFTAPSRPAPSTTTTKATRDRDVESFADVPRERSERAERSEPISRPEPVADRPRATEVRRERETKQPRVETPSRERPSTRTARPSTPRGTPTGVSRPADRSSRSAPPSRQAPRVSPPAQRAPAARPAPKAAPKSVRSGRVTPRKR